MSTKLVSCFYDIGEVLCKNKMMSYNNNINTGGTVLPLLDRKAVGTPTLVEYQRRHSVTFGNTNSKFTQNQLLNSLKLEQAAGTNKENRFRDRSLSETGLQKPQGQVNSSRYKTELCRPFEENGSCKYGDKCQFAHGAHELRSLARHPKYKTELCRTFHTIGFCPYGPRCHFIHNAEERRLSAHDPHHLPLSPCNKVDRPCLQHSYSFSGFSSPSNGLLDSPTSITPPPIFTAEDLSSSPTLPSCASNPFTYSSQELASLFAPSMGMQVPAAPTGCGAHSPTTFLLRPLAESPRLFEPSPSPLDSLSDDCLSSCGSASGSESPTLDFNKRLPIFSRLSISDD